jgi:hypothetical protein
MNLEAELQGIVRENEGDLLLFARKLYEHGYRQGLASRPQGQVEPEAASPTASPALPPAPLLGPLFSSHAKLAAIPDEGNDEPEGSDVSSTDDEDDEIATCDHRVRGSITIAGLQKKIERLFALSRFDIEVVICRRQDPERRRLKSTVRLKNYLLEGE